MFSWPPAEGAKISVMVKTLKGVNRIMGWVGLSGEGDENVLRAANGFGKLAQDARRRLAVFNCDI